MKKKYIIIPICIILIISLLAVWIQGYKWDIAAYKTTGYNHRGGQEICYIEIKPYQDKQIILNCKVKDGEFNVTFYKIPEDHTVLLFMDATDEELAALYNAGIKRPTTSDGMEYKESYIINEDGEYVVDTADWEYGQYAIEILTDDNISGNMVISLKYKIYNWLWLKKKFLVLIGRTEEATEGVFSPY